MAANQVSSAATGQPHAGGCHSHSSGPARVRAQIIPPNVASATSE